MLQNNNTIGIVSIALAILIIFGLLLFFNITFDPEKAISAGSDKLEWINYFIKFYVIISVIGLSANLILMHIIFTRMKGFYEG
ncbi:MAG: hypothetical protein C00003105_02189 [ANME-2 cluster archaeon HR1]|jgi:uncharacterized membrane protein|nr:MAG: hypothetical protein C5S41_13000 [ANME-2 cluster archaeon]MEA3294501.1 hypothetical protein [Euryarchaeota archaeon]PPA80461.1 MAG: hypothetical protein C00003105_02189 [ANME-2 cluster archaeon HR1]